MVNIPKLRAQMALKGYTQKRVAEEMTARGVKTSENTFSSMMNGTSKFDTDDVDVICEILEIVDPAEKAEIFLA